MTGRHRDVAASAQAVLERWMLALAERVHHATRSSTLCVAGGVGLNAVANGRLAREGPFDRVFFQPVAGDAGTALGSASVAMIELGGPRPAPLRDLRLGARTDRNDVTALLYGLGVPYSVLSEADLVEAVAELLEAGGVVGWFDGAAEFGPRALGARSLLADPRHASIRDRINRSMKERETWRPLAPMVAEEDAERLFEASGPFPFMIETTLVREGVHLEGVTHVDRTARPQTVSCDDQPLLHALLKAFERRAGVPVLINTSFNHASEPIVDTPAQAVMTAARLGLDGLVIAGYFITELDLAGEAQLSYWMHTPSAVSSNLYAL